MVGKLKALLVRNEAFAAGLFIGFMAVIAMAVSFIANINGIVVIQASEYGVVCDGVHDQNPSSSGPLQKAISAAGVQAGPATGWVQLPAACGNASGKQLVFSTGLTVPDNVGIEGLGGSCWDGSAVNCVEMDFTGNGSVPAITSTTTKGIVLKNFRIRNTGGGTGRGIHLIGTFRAKLEGVSVEGFTSSYGLWLDDTTATVESTQIEDSSFDDNGGAVLFDGTGSPTHAVGNTLIENSNLWGSTGNANVVMTSNNTNAGTTGYENVYDNTFIDDDFSQAAQSATIGLQSNGTLNTIIVSYTAESLEQIFQLNTGTQGFYARGEAATLPTNTDWITASGDSTFDVCASFVGGSGSNDCRTNMPKRMAYVEPTTLQDPTGGVSIGNLTNDVLYSEDFTQSNWAKSGIASSNNNGTTPYGIANAATQLVLTPGGAVSVMQTFDSGSSIASTTWEGMAWAKVNTGVVRIQQFLYDGGGTQFAGGGIDSETLTTTYKPIYVLGTAGVSQTSHSVEWRPLYISANAPSVTITLWGAHLWKVQPGQAGSGPAAYWMNGASDTSPKIVGINTALINNQCKGTVTLNAASPAVATASNGCILANCQPSVNDQTSVAAIQVTSIAAGSIGFKGANGSSDVVGWACQ